MQENLQNEKTPEISRETSNFLVFLHLSQLSGLIIPLGNLIVPIVMWLVRKDEKLIDKQGRMVVNFQISMTIYMIIPSIIMFFYLFSAEEIKFAVFFIIVIAIFILIPILVLIMAIVNSIRASKNEKVSYPLTIKFLG